MIHFPAWRKRQNVSRVSDTVTGDHSITVALRLSRKICRLLFALAEVCADTRVLSAHRRSRSEGQSFQSLKTRRVMAEPETERLATGACRICNQLYEEDGELSVLPCNHEFHIGCAQNHFDQNDYCPECSEKVDWIEDTLEVQWEGRGEHVTDILGRRAYGSRGDDFIEIGSLPPNLESSERELRTEVSRERLWCSICLAEYELGVELTRLPCMHEHHTSCLIDWFRNHRDCVVCRQPIALGRDDPDVQRILGTIDTSGEGLSDFERSLLPTRIFMGALLDDSRGSSQFPAPTATEIAHGPDPGTTNASPSSEHTTGSAEALETSDNSRPPRDRENDMCLICRSEYEPGEVLQRLPCFHEYHRDCITNWLVQEARCPVCRNEVCSESSSGLTREQIERLPAREFASPSPESLTRPNPGMNARGDTRQVSAEVSTEANEANSLSPWRCAICQCSYESNQLLKRLSCLHEVHSSCLTAWISTRGDCPSCNRDLVASMMEVLDTGSVSLEEAVDHLPIRRLDTLSSAPSVGATSPANGDSSTSNSVFQRMCRALRRSISLPT